MAPGRNMPYLLQTTETRNRNIAEARTKVIKLASRVTNGNATQYDLDNLKNARRRLQDLSTRQIPIFRFAEYDRAAQVARELGEDVTKIVHVTDEDAKGMSSYDLRGIAAVRASGALGTNIPIDNTAMAAVANGVVANLKELVS